MRVYTSIIVYIDVGIKFYTSTGEGNRDGAGFFFSSKKKTLETSYFLPIVQAASKRDAYQSEILFTRDMFYWSGPQG